MSTFQDYFFCRIVLSKEFVQKKISSTFTIVSIADVLLARDAILGKERVTKPLERLVEGRLQ